MRCRGLGASLAFAPAFAAAAGGHHAIDDATILDPGQCQAESWLERSHAGQRVFHIGTACRVRAIELGVAADRLSGDSQAKTDTSAELKWATALTGDCSVGALGAAYWQGQPRRHGTTTLLLPLTCSRGAWSFHANAGRDLVKGAPDHFRGGVAAERTLSGFTTATAELFSESGISRCRAALRLTLGSWSIDFGHQRAVRQAADRSWTVGAAVTFE